uniref:NR LBD domain-containing protein n=1 Tax=Panagrellus redivivus TaxID=6233 RepID=A0A7E4ZUT2_PANRE
MSRGPIKRPLGATWLSIMKRGHAITMLGARLSWLGQNTPKCSSCRLKKCHAVGMQANSVQRYRDAIGKPSATQCESDTESLASSISEKVVFNETYFHPPTTIFDTLKETYNSLLYQRGLFYSKSQLLDLFMDRKLDYTELGHYSEGLPELYYTEPRFCITIINESEQLMSVSGTDKKRIFGSFARHLQALEDLYYSGKYGSLKNGRYWVLPNKKCMNITKMESYFIDGGASQPSKKSQRALRTHRAISSHLIEVMETYMNIVKPSYYDFIFLFGLLLFDPTTPKIAEDTRNVLQNLHDQLMKDFFTLCQMKLKEPEIRLADVLMLITGIKYYERQLHEEMKTLRYCNVLPVDMLFDEIWSVESFKNNEN